MLVYSSINNGINFVQYFRKNVELFANFNKYIILRISFFLNAQLMDDKMDPSI